MVTIIGLAKYMTFMDTPTHFQEGYLVIPAAVPKSSSAARARGPVMHGPTAYSF
jgi:hypothetical protein